MTTKMNKDLVIPELDVNLERDLFLRMLIRELAGTLEEVVGVDEASGYISVVGQNIGDWINQNYKSVAGVDNFTQKQVTDVLLDLKKRIHGEFYVIEQDDEKIVLGNKKCPFEDKVVGRTSMCMMTSNVFGGIAAEHLGFAKVELQETIAQGNSGCRVVVHLKTTPESDMVEGREYYRKVE